MRHVEQILPPQRWSLEQILDLAEVFLATIAHPSMDDARLGYLHRGRLQVERDVDGTILGLRIVGDAWSSRSEVPEDAVAAPELRDGSTAASLATDAYLLGALIYETLTGKPLPAYLPRRRLDLDVRRFPGLYQLMTVTLDESHRARASNADLLYEAIAVARAETQRRVTSLEVAQLSVVGEQRRKLDNQDAIGTFLHQRTERSWPMCAGLFVACDGVGSSLGGGSLARHIVRQSEYLFRELVDRDAPRALAEALDEHLRALVQTSIERGVSAYDAERQEQGETVRAASTVVMSLVLQGRAAFAWLGDSRAYLLGSDGVLTPLTLDHNTIGDAYRAARAERSSLSEGGWSDIITGFARCPQDDAPTHLGRVEVMSDWTCPGERVLHLEPGDQLLLTTDGLTGAVDEETIAEVLGSAPSAHDAAEGLIAATRGRPDQDNMGLVVVRPRFTQPIPYPRVGPPGRV